MRQSRQANLIKQMTHRELTAHLYLTQLILLMVSLIAGAIFFDIADILLRFKFDSRWVFWGVVNGAAVAGIDIMLMNLLPERYYDDGGINNKIFKAMPFWQIPLVALVVAFTEELLFRGIVQTSIGLVAASILFAVIHLRYWTHWYLMVNVIILSFWIGIVYEMADRLLWPVIAMHFTIDCLLGIYIKFGSFRKDL
ncbi:CPBP family intramembrane metalloprotease [Siminovitchia fortis]|uniref:CPBP family intramembrane metalloprotease n=1 Tax=Siminovitchia fortis TaxID=254758 RepID=A0A443J3I9_9BACI|nr:CPBP family intramembrane glutamic endopeptidase [Siminovitchia fortis]RWR15009.1 CPBP family intramembrane metalloprotease [Siminovitchia fortis]WHY82856.1 CPBP family intramembrane metalloprotease [Siminovitchia fortis]